MRTNVRQAVFEMFFISYFLRVKIRTEVVEVYEVSSNESCLRWKSTEMHVSGKEMYRMV